MADSMDKKYSNVPNLRFNEYSNSEYFFVALKEISVLITKGTTPHQFTNKGVNYIKIDSLEGTNINPDKLTYISNEEHTGFLKRSILEENDVLLAIAGATVGKHCLVPKIILPANTNQALSVIRLKNKFLAPYLLHYFDSHKLKEYISLICASSAQPNLNLEQVGNFQISLSTNNDENKKISSFLTLLNKRIESQNNIIRVFESLIKSVTTKIYNGYKRKIKISNLVTFEKKTLHKSQDGLSNGMFPFYTNEEHQTKFYNSFDYDGLYILANTGGKANFKIVDGKFAVMSDTLVIRFNEPRLARTYIYYLQNNTKKINHDAFSGSGLKHLDKDAFLNMSVPLIDEHIDELNKLFELFENKLLLEKRILKVLLLQKQYLLNNMFI